MKTKLIWHKPEDELPKDSDTLEKHIIWIDKFSVIKIGYYIKNILILWGYDKDRWVYGEDYEDGNLYDSTSDVVYWAYLNVPDIYKELK